MAVAWTRSQRPDGARLSLVCSEHGGPPVRDPRTRGFGVRLIDRGAKLGLKGSARRQLHPRGVTCELQFPLLEAEA